MVKRIINSSVVTAALVLSVALTGCGGTTDGDSAEAHGTASTLEVAYGYYGTNGDMGTSDTIRIIWTKNTTMESELSLTSDIDTSTDAYLESKFGYPHYHYSIDKATAPGVYTLTCEPSVRTGDWTEYSCSRDGLFTDEQDSEVDYGFVVENPSTNLVFDANPENTGNYTLGFITVNN